MGCSINTYEISNAAANGHINILQWLLANEIPWNTRAFISAAKNGHLDTMCA